MGAYDDFLDRMPAIPAGPLIDHGSLTSLDFAGCFFFGEESGLPTGLIDDSRTIFRWLPPKVKGLSWRVEFFSADGSAVTSLGLPLHRTLIVDAPLRARASRGRIAFNHLTCLEASKRRRGIGRRLAAREESLFRKWAAEEVQLDAGCEAKESGAWFHLGFDLSIEARRNWADWWAEYQFYGLDKKEAELMPLPSLFLDFERKFLEGIKPNVITIPLVKIL